MSYNLILKINDELIKQVPSIFYPFRYGTIGSFLSSLLIPAYGSEAIYFVQEDFKDTNLNIDNGSLLEIEKYISSFKDKLLSEICAKVFDYINNEFYGNLRSFFQADYWQVDSYLSNVLEGNEEFRDSILLFTFSVPICPISSVMQDIMVNFHIFEPDETYMEIQAILNDFYTDTPKCQRNYLVWKYLDSLDEEECDKILSKIESIVPFTCDGCGGDIKGLTSPYITRVEVYPSRNLKFDSQDLDYKDFEKEVSSILESANQKSEKELTKEVWTEYRLFLCPRCRNTFVNRIESGEFI